MEYAELHCLTNFTFLRGASHPQELVETAIRRGYKALAITDECSLAGVVRAHVAAREHGNAFRLIIGAEFRLDDGLRFVLLAQNREGYGHLSELITRGRRNAPKGEYRLSRDHLESGIPHCLALWLPPAQPLDEDASWFAMQFPDRCWIAVELLARAGDRKRLALLQETGERNGLPRVASGDVYMHARGRRALQDTLTAIRLGVPVARAGLALQASGEHHLRRLDALEKIYPAALIEETLRIANLCSFSLDELQYEYPEEIVPRGKTPPQYLAELTEAGLRQRYKNSVPQAVRESARKELELIAEKRYEAFFLTVYDIVTHARSQEILCQGRGSAANSVVCFALGITEVDPTHTRLLFGRFLSKERDEPPDIDVDFEHQRREEVIQYIYRKYGRHRTALAATVICYRTRSAFRDVGKALGLDSTQLDRITASFVWWDNVDERATRLREVGFEPGSPLIRRLLSLTETLSGFPRHLSQHVGGFVISRGPLSELVPTENATMKDRTVIQWDKDDLEALGLLKVDVLALGMLTAIRLALNMVNRRHSSSLSMADILATESGNEGKPVYAMLCKADSIGVFQVESRAQMSMLPRLKPENYYDLVVEVAIVRPGPIQGGMVHPYLKNRKLGREKVKYPSPELEEVLKRTLGVPIFQEQVMEIAMVAADFSAGKADKLRRAMAAWKRKGGLEPFKDDLINGMLKNGYEEKFALQIFKQIKGFGEYGFPESHSASFALLVYVSAWLKHYHPATFTCALLNSQPMGFYSPPELVQDALRHGVEVRAVDVLASSWDCSLEETTENKPAIRLGFRMAKSLSESGAKRLIEVRALKHYDSIEEFLIAADLSRKDMNALAAAGALESLAGHRRNAAWLVAGIEKRPALLARAAIVESEITLMPLTEAQDILADYDSNGLTLRRHPLALLRPRFEKHSFSTAEQLRHMPTKTPVHVVGLVTCRQHPGTAKGVIFVTLEDETGQINVVVWKKLSQKQRRPLLGARLLHVEGTLEREGDVIHVIAENLVDRSVLIGNLNASSRDFH
ncbi:MAG TPA: error-prone DNA polymerase [Burkholderiales bacterium]|nr:error-prone DNA polymerase [Burkholderiales bacterium]